MGLPLLIASITGRPAFVPSFLSGSLYETVVRRYMPLVTYAYPRNALLSTSAGPFDKAPRRGRSASRANLRTRSRRLLDDSAPSRAICVSRAAGVPR